MKDRIYVTGGHYGYRGNCTYETVQVYRTDVNEWSILTTTPHPGEELSDYQKNGIGTVLNCNIIFSRVRLVFSVPGEHVVFGGWTDDCCGLLQHSQ